MKNFHASIYSMQMELYHIQIEKYHKFTYNNKYNGFLYLVIMKNL